MGGPGAIERRAGGAFRASGRRLTGLAVAYDSPSADLGGFVETIRAGAFRRSLSENGDVLALYSHDARSVLGRTSADTLRLWEEPSGIGFELHVARTSWGDDVLALVEERNLTGCSFGFSCRRDEWPAPDRREVIDGDLLEISMVASPAYPATTVAMRAATAPWRLPLAERALQLRRARTWA